MNDSPPKPNRYSHPGKAGRKPKPSTLVSRALLLVDKNLPDIFSALITKALEGDREAQIYLIDRRLGKPKQAMELEGGERLGVGMIAEVLRIVAEERKRLQGGYNGIQGQIEAKGSEPGGNEEEKINRED